MDDKKYLQDLKDIREMMHRSTQFISLSGLSGVLAGVYALIGAFIAKQLLNDHVENTDDYGRYVTLESHTFKYIMATAIAVLLLSVGTALLMSKIKAQKNGESVWNATARRLVVNFLIPLATGGIFALLLLRHQVYGLIAPVTLIFYGLACVNASKYTFKDVRWLGVTVIILGLLAVEFSGYAIEFWALGFGVCHIIYGGIMHFKYERNAS